MILLDDTTTKLQLVTSTGGDVHVAVSYVERVDAPHREQYRSQETAITTATTTDILAVPSDGRRRQVEHISVVNVDAALAQTVILVKDVNGTDYELTSEIALAVGESFTVDAEGAYRVYSATGVPKSAGSIDGVLGLTSGGTGATTAAGVRTALGLWTTKIKPATESITSDNTLSDDAELVIALAAATKYFIRVNVLFTTSATPGFKFATAYSSTVTGTPQSYYRGLIGGSAGGAGVELSGQVAGLITSAALAGATTGTGHVAIEQIIETNGAGNWSFQWAQNTSGGATTSVFWGSNIEYKVVA